MNMKIGMRPSPIAGAWYSANPATLAAQIDKFLSDAEIPHLPGEVLGLMAPHAGYRYSGKTAAYAYKTILGKKYDLVAVISPMHGYVPAEIITSAHQAYLTPFGKVNLAQSSLDEFSENITKQYGLHLTRIADDDEHSLEIQLPFLQHVLSEPFELLPIMLRTKDETVLQGLGLALGQVLKNKRALLVASTDLSHFYPLAEANQLDHTMLAEIAAFSPEGVLRAEKRGSGYACGAPAVAVVMHAAQVLGADAITVLHHSTSAEQTGDTGSVVGYGAAVILKKEAA